MREANYKPTRKDEIGSKVHYHKEPALINTAQTPMNQFGIFTTVAPLVFAAVLAVFVVDEILEAVETVCWAFSVGEAVEEAAELDPVTNPLAP